MTAQKRAVAVLISGRGSNMRALIEAAKDPAYPAWIALVISNRADAEGLDYAKQHGIETALVPSKGKERAAFDAEVDALLKAKQIEFVCLAGFMRILTPEFVAGWTGRMINIHPSLLPAFKGVNVHEQAIEAGVRISGCTVHFVIPELDDGPIILQAAVPVPPGATAEQLSELVLEQEHRIYPQALHWLAEDRLQIDGRVVRIRDAGTASGAMISPSL